MSNRVTYKLQHRNLGIEKISFHFPPNGASQPAAVTGRGVASLTRASTGVFTITLSDSYEDLVGASVLVGLATAADITVQLGAVDVKSAKTIVLRTLASAVLTDIAADPDNIIWVELSLRNTSVQ